MDCYFIDLILLYHDHLTSWCDMWCYQKSTPLKPPKPVLPWIYVNKHQIQCFRSLPYDSELLCCAGFGQVCFCLSDVAHGVYYRASPGVPHFSLNMVDCWFNINLYSTDDRKSSSYALPPRVLIVSIAVYCCVNCWGAVQCEDMLHSPTKKW